MKPERTLLIDADFLVFAAASVSEDQLWFDSEPVYKANFDHGCAYIDDKVKELKETLEASHVVMALSDYTDPWRKKVLKSYKANRKDKRKPEGMPELRQYIHETYVTHQWPGLEGDDVLGILMTQVWDMHELVDPNSERICCSGDKDMRTIPGFHYNWKKPEEGIVFVSEFEADKNHMLQTLTGDRVDGFFGLPGVGPVKAHKILEGCNNKAQMWSKVKQAYSKKGRPISEAMEQARVARICRACDYDFEKREVILWEPLR